MNKLPHTLSLSKVTAALLAKLDARSRDVISRRFGVKTGIVETLESIGREYGITRERVRQIEAQAKKTLAQQTEALAPVATLFEQVFAAEGGIIADVRLSTSVQNKLVPGETVAASHVSLYLEILPPYAHLTRDAYFQPHWRHPALVSATAVPVVTHARTTLKKAGHPLPQDQLFSALLAAIGSTVPAQQIESFLTASKQVQRTPFGEWGLTGWPETNPRGVGDKAYAVLRRHGKPEHFTEITTLINDARFDHKRANPQTVHNELIKDDRFVLVGRGLYGLAEWGYIPGTVADVLESLLRKAERPLSRDELIEQVLAQRQVKKNTILLGLQNEKRFVKTAENRYTLKERS